MEYTNATVTIRIEGIETDYGVALTPLDKSLQEDYLDDTIREIAAKLILEGMGEVIISK